MNKIKIDREKEEIGESSNQELIPGEPREPMVFEHEVFLSFRGADTRTNFTAHLYSHLTKDCRIRTFRDSEKLHVGEKIGTLMKAINKSKIMIPIFSKRYASSEWCLMELTQMVKFVEMNKETTMICPIFYDVTPSEVRNQTGSFQEALDGHIKKFGTETVDEWKEALKTVSKIKGWERDEIESGDEAQLVAIVGDELTKELKKMHVKLTEHLVGTDQHEAELMQLLELDSNEVKIVGIVGMGGIGKTTIAKFIHNKLCNQFRLRCSFLENVQETLKQSEGLQKLKNQLMSDILKRKWDRMKMNRSTFRSTKALIVLDDVEDRSQLMKIIEGRDWFGPGSRIIVTTRNRDTLREEGGENVYEPGEMNSENALRLFCKHAFRRDCPLQGYETVSKEVVSSVAGLPLSLEVIGSLLSTKKRQVWEEILKKLRKIMPEEVQERLQISYDMLDDGEKEIFLDIACHFLYSDEDTRRAASYMWEDCEFYPVLGIDHLITFSLVKVDENGRFRMHDQLRDLGREIVRKENPKNPGGRSRLWSRQVALDVLTRRTGTENVQTLTLTLDETCGSLDCLSSEEFKGLSELRYLDLSTESILEGDFKGLLSNLRWFRFYSGSQIPEITNFCLPKLVVLDLSISNISDGWEEVIQIKEATNLKILDLSWCDSLTKTPDLSAFSKLERLNLEECSDLVEISPSIGHLQHLNYLNLNSCFKLMWSKLPEFIWKLKSLVELHMEKLRGVTELSEDIRNLANLKILDVKGTEIKKLPIAFGKLEKLEEFNASWCESLEELPKTFGDLQNLKRLDISFSGVNWLPSEIGRLEKLEMLDAQGCKSWRELPESIENLRSLKRLDISDSGIKRLPSAIKRLEKLEELDAGGCKLLGELPESIGNLRSLILLGISETGVKRLPSAIGRLEKLEELYASDCKSLRELPESIENLTNLRILDVSSTAIKKLPAGIGKLQKLEVLLCGRSSLEGELPSGVWSLSALRELKLNNTRISSLGAADLSCCSHLTTLDLGSCPDLRLPSSELKLPPGLERLEIPLTKASLDSVVRLPELLSLAFHQCHRREDDMVEFPIDLGGLFKLNRLEFHGCRNFTSLPVKINNLPWPRFLSIGGGGLADGRSGRLVLHGCESLERLPDLSNALEKLRINNCPKLSHIDGGLSVLTSLVELEIENCPSLESLPDFSALQCLEQLTISRCEKLLKIRGLEALTSLRRLELKDCPSLEKLPDLSHLKWLMVRIFRAQLRAREQGSSAVVEVRRDG